VTYARSSRNGLRSARYLALALFLLAACDPPSTIGEAAIDTAMKSSNERGAIPSRP